MIQGVNEGQSHVGARRKWKQREEIKEWVVFIRNETCRKMKKTKRGMCLVSALKNHSFNLL